MYNGSMPYISPNYSIEDLLSLCVDNGLSPSSCPELFERAIAMFMDRIRGRFLNQIDLLSDNISVNGFAIMALECLLVETLAQFREGLPDTKRCSKEKYTEFLLQIDEAFSLCPAITDFRSYSDYFNQAFDRNGNVRNNAVFFYNRIRCGILHQAQSSNNSGLTDDNEEYPVFWKNGYYIVSVPMFIFRMNAYIENYSIQLRNEENYTLRANFINKMRYICRLSKINW